MKKATGSKEVYAGKSMIHFGDNFQLKCVKDTPVYANYFWDFTDTKIGDENYEKDLQDDLNQGDNYGDFRD